MRGGIERRLPPAFEDVGSGGVDVGKIGSDRVAAEIQVAIRLGDEHTQADHRGEQHGERDQPHPLAR